MKINLLRTEGLITKGLQKLSRGESHFIKIRKREVIYRLIHEHDFIFVLCLYCLHDILNWLISLTFSYFYSSYVVINRKVTLFEKKSNLKSLI